MVLRLRRVIIHSDPRRLAQRQGGAHAREEARDQSIGGRCASLAHGTVE
jgi:hypothetical protein